ncbi:hypothetical protein [Actinoplanes auranticolor]|uniref:hypothetical protein n=1 Tax=Actinoplanes auranticolor TaxID=47988 RepID=UPI001BB369D1|nr:hypothetical protein [Actinoplanes auranticolor]
MNNTLIGGGAAAALILSRYCAAVRSERVAPSLLCDPVEPGGWPLRSASSDCC